MKVQLIQSLCAGRVRWKCGEFDVKGVYSSSVLSPIEWHPAHYCAKIALYMGLGSPATDSSKISWPRRLIAAITE